MIATRIVVDADPADGRFKMRLAAARRLAASEIPRQRATLYTYTILYPMTREGQPARRQPCRYIGSPWTTQRDAEVTKAFVGKGLRHDSKRRSRFAETVDGKHRAL
jgi:hypothetical protein